MSADARIGALSADPRSIAELHRGAKTQDPATLREVARQFESLFAGMLLKSMREANLGEGMFDSQEGEMYRDMFDQQISVELTKGKGLGLADMLVRQLSGAGAGKPAAESSAATQPGAATAPAGTAAAPATTTTTPPATAAGTQCTAAAGEAPVTTWPPASREDFVRALWPHAEAAGRALGIDPATIVSHAALETGWGRSQPGTADGTPSFNLFGIKAGRSWGGAATTNGTIEVEGGVAVRRQQKFRAYSSLGEGIGDYARMLGSNPRYSAALNTGSDVRAFAAALQRGGYATDPNYASKLGQVAASVRSVLQGGSLKVADARPISAHWSAT